MVLAWVDLSWVLNHFCPFIMAELLGHVHVIDDDAHLRESISDLVQFAGHQVSVWPSAVSFLEASPALIEPSVIVTDMRMPAMTGLDLHRRLLESGRPIPMIYISGESSLQQGIQAMKLGATEFLLKPFSAQSLLAAIAKALLIDSTWRKKHETMAILDEKLLLLTPREAEVYRLMLKGCNNAEIMSSLHLSLPTTKQYKSAVMRKLGVQTLSQLLALSKGERG